MTLAEGHCKKRVVDNVTFWIAMDKVDDYDKKYHTQDIKDRYTKIIAISMFDANDTAWKCSSVKKDKLAECYSNVYLSLKDDLFKCASEEDLQTYLNIQL